MNPAQQVLVTRRVSQKTCAFFWRRSMHVCSQAKSHFRVIRRCGSIILLFGFFFKQQHWPWRTPPLVVLAIYNYWGFLSSGTMSWGAQSRHTCWPANCQPISLDYHSSLDRTLARHSHITFMNTKKQENFHECFVSRDEKCLWHLLMD